MPATFQLQVATQEGVILSEEATALVAPGVEGSFGVLAHHAPMVVELGVGELKVTDADERVSHYATAGGILEVRDNRVVLLADVAEAAEEIDVERARAAKERAEQRLHGQVEDISALDLDRARLALLKAINRLRVADHDSG
jgi:F-type H+-transporting ATPase subunit epsilon